MNASHTMVCETKHDNKSCIRHGILFGLILVGAGVLYLLEHTGVLVPFTASQFWPAIFIPWGLSNLVVPQRIFGKIFGLALMVGGTLGLSHSLGYTTVPWGVVWPAALAVLGVTIVIGILVRKRTKAPLAQSEGGAVAARLVMGSREERYDGHDFDGGNISVTMGEYRLDLTDSQMKGDEAVLAVKLTMGEVKLRIPTGWRVKIEGTPMMGTVQDKTIAVDEPDAPVLRIPVHLSLGELEIRN